MRNAPFVIRWVNSMPNPPTRRSLARPSSKPKPVRPVPPEDRVSPGDVTLVRTKGTAERGGGPGGEAWTIMCGETRAGRVFINWIDEPPIGQHASVQIYLNRQSQGRGIGRVAYRLASHESQYETIYAHMRKSNVASQRAASAAGYSEISLPNYNQHLMRWTAGGQE